MPPLLDGIRLWCGGIRKKELITFLITIRVRRSLSSTGSRDYCSRSRSSAFPPNLSVRGPQLVFPDGAEQKRVRLENLQRRFQVGISVELTTVKQIGASQSNLQFSYLSPPSIQDWYPNASERGRKERRGRWGGIDMEVDQNH